MNDSSVVETHRAEHRDTPASACMVCTVEAAATRDPKTCPHEDFAAFVDVGRITEEGGTDPYYFSAEVYVVCAQCGAPFGWRGFENRVGVSPREPLVTPDALVLRAPLIPPSDLELLGPLAAMRPDSGPDGPALRMRIRDGR